MSLTGHAESACHHPPPPVNEACTLPETATLLSRAAASVAVWHCEITVHGRVVLLTRAILTMSKTDGEESCGRDSVMGGRCERNKRIRMIDHRHTTWTKVVFLVINKVDSPRWPRSPTTTNPHQSPTTTNPHQSPKW